MNKTHIHCPMCGVGNTTQHPYNIEIVQPDTYHCKLCDFTFECRELIPKDTGKEIDVKSLDRLPEQGYETIKAKHKYIIGSPNCYVEYDIRLLGDDGHIYLMVFGDKHPDYSNDCLTNVITYFYKSIGTYEK